MDSTWSLGFTFYSGQWLGPFISGDPIPLHFKTTFEERTMKSAMTAFLLVTMCLSPFSFSQQVEPSTGQAKNKDGKLVYIEKHESRYDENGKLQHLKTEYHEPNGGKFGFFDTKYIEHPFVPEYEFRDDRKFRAELVEIEKDTVKAKVQFDQSQPKKEKTYKISANMVAGQGLHNYLRTHIDQFVANPQRVDQVEFLVPANETSYTFRIRAKNISEGKITYRVEADSWLFRLVAPHIEAQYEIASKRLLIYDGPSNLVNTQGKQEKVVITYSYDPASEKSVALSDQKEERPKN